MNFAEVEKQFRKFSCEILKKRLHYSLNGIGRILLFLVSAIVAITLTIHLENQGEYLKVHQMDSCTKKR